ncbi:MAG: alginate export family protein [Thermodesulfobacteriota bacterium]|nr:alginate export family protein [Thermodesulfobacteriota bacterium]
MKRMLIMFLALSMVAVIALPAFAEVQNIKVTGSVLVRGFYRDNYATTGSGSGAVLTGFTETGSRDWYNTQTKIGIAADLTDNVGAAVVLGNERDWGVSTATSTTTTGLDSNGDTYTYTDTTADNSSEVQIRSAYITMQEMLYSPLTVKVGRMPVRVADGLAIGDGTTGEGVLGSDYADSKEYDAIMGTLDYDPLTLHIGTAKVVDKTQNAGDDTDLYVIDAVYKFEDDMNTVLDAYYTQAHYASPGLVGTGWTDTSTTGVDINVLAAMVTLEPMYALTAKVGIALQRGDYIKNPTTSRDLDAMAYDLGLNYALDNEYSPVVGFKYIYRSGQDNSKNTGDYEGWLALSEDQTNGVIYDPNTNISAIAFNVTAVPADRLTVGLEYWIYSLAESQVATGTTSNDDEAGTELDLTAQYAYTEDVSMGLNLAWFWPGDYYVGGNDETAMQAMLEMGVKF